MVKDKAGWNKYRHKKSPIEPSEAVVQIESLTNSGDGLARLERRVIFVPYTIPGDQVRIAIRQRKKTYALAELKDIIEPSPDRIEPRCPYFTQCGGCDWQHVPYSLQLQAKQEQLRETLKRIGLLSDLPMEPIVASDNEFSYRNRIQGEVRGGQFHFKYRRSEQRIAVERCDIADEAINHFLQTDLHQSPQGRVEIALVNDTVSALPIDEKNSTTLGFRQVNATISEQLSQRVLGIVAQSESHQIIDLYCGRGAWTNAIAQRHPDKTLIGVDASSENTDQAIEQAHALDLHNVRYLRSPVNTVLKKLPIAHSLCIVDPPRAGLDPALTDALIDTPCKTLIYVSCHPATLARDLKRLTDNGYHITTLIPMDMFPQTAHLECLVVLSRPDT